MTRDTLSIEHEDLGRNGVYRASVPGSDEPARLTWKAMGPDVRVADHTFVPPEARGLGIAERLVEAMVADARAQGFRIDPACPYVAKLFAERSEWRPLKA
jgi:predicted GNAT family acetyltransferase